MNNQLPRRAEALIECVGQLARLVPSAEDYAADKVKYQNEFTRLAVALTKDLPETRLKKAVRSLMNKVQAAQEMLEEALEEASGGTPSYTPRRFFADCNRAGAAFLQETSLIAQTLPDAAADGDEDLHPHDQEALEILRRSSKSETALRAGLLSQPVYLGFAPVIPLATFDHDKLRRIGIPSANFRGYVVLEQQRVLGISFAAVQHHAETLAKLGEGKEHLAKIKRAKNFESIDRATQAFLDSVYDSMIEVFFRKYPDLTQVGNPTAWNGARWYWVMKKRELALLRGAALSEKSFRLDRWDFAFASRARTLKPSTPK